MSTSPAQDIWFAASSAFGSALDDEISHQIEGIATQPQA